MMEKFSYRPEIDGLRAIAVAVVILFHSEMGCPGGYVGVDVFFVISGFLIASLIWKDLENGSFTLAGFWGRRARRIIPALVVVTCATLMAGFFLLLPGDLKSLGQAAASLAVFCSNIYCHYWMETGYFAGPAAEKPLLHTWTLAVEEQFYLVVPFLFWGLFHFLKANRLKATLFMLSAGVLLSLALSSYCVARHPSAAFYLLPSRAWELLLGAVVAFLPRDSALMQKRILREFFALAGLALVLIPVFVYTSETPFPGLAALSPCLGAALIIWSNVRITSRMPTVIGSLLATRALVFIGAISYSLYLWHWPVLAFSKYVALEPITTWQRALLPGMGFLLAVLSWKYVETPFRRRKIGGTEKSMFAYAGAGLAVVLGGGLLLMTGQGFPQRLASRELETAGTNVDGWFKVDLAMEDVLAGKFTQIGATDPALSRTVLVWGDSHAIAALPALDACFKEKNIAGLAVTHAATAPVPGGYVSNGYSLGKDTLSYNDAILRYIQTHQINDVILIARWKMYVASWRNAAGEPGDFNLCLLDTVRKLNAMRVRTWIVLDVPSFSFSVPRVLFCPLYSQAYIESLCAKSTALDNTGKVDLNSNDPKLVAELETAGCHVLDPKPEFLDLTGRHYVIQTKGVPLYRDSNHLTEKGARLMLLPFFRHVLTIEKR